MTARVLRAMRNPHADILFHPTARIIGKREAVDLDLDAVIACARETGTVLELDAYPDRSDLKDDHIRKVVGAGREARHRLRRALDGAAALPGGLGHRPGPPRLGKRRRRAEHAAASTSSWRR